MAEIVKSGVSAEDLALINSFAKAELKAEDVYTFKVACCDNQIDRDFEKISDRALNQLAELYVGKTIIKDHDPETDNQCARIFKTETEDDGSGGKRLIAYGYMPVSEKNREFISDIETGIKKEVSVSFACRSCVCSICGKDIFSCRHIKSKVYDGKMCCGILDDVYDAYELSFVAVPAQRGAGVIKSFKRDLKNQQSDDEKLKAEKLEIRLRLAKAETDILT